MFYRRHLLPPGRRARPARLPHRARAGARGLSRSRRGAGAVAGAGDPAGAWTRTSTRPRRGRRRSARARGRRSPDARVFDPVNGGFGTPAQVSPSRRDDAPAPPLVRPRRSRRVRTIVDRTLARHGARRLPRPARRRIPPLQRGRASGSCRTSRRCPTTTRSCSRRIATRARCSAPSEYARGRARDRALGPGGAVAPGGRVRRQPGCRRRPGGRRRLLHLDPRRDGRGARRPTSSTSPPRIRHRDRGRDAPRSRRKNVLFRRAPPCPSWPTERQEPRKPSASLLDSAAGKLRAARDQRPAPFVDRTRYTTGTR